MCIYRRVEVLQMKYIIYEHIKTHENAHVKALSETLLKSEETSSNANYAEPNVQPCFSSNNLCIADKRLYSRRPTIRMTEA